MQKDDNKNYEELGFAKIDHARRLRSGYPEVIMGDCKSAEQITVIFKSLISRSSTVICTRTAAAVVEEVLSSLPGVRYHKECRLLIYEESKPELRGCVVIATGGTGDIPVAEEAALILEAYGSKVRRLYDVGVAGVHRLLSNMDYFEGANCVIAVAGMEGALPSVIAGLVSVPVIAVPTSVGYGANFGGITAMLAMLNSCASGVSVVNIGNGFGAACQADMINKLAINGGTR